MSKQKQKLFCFAWSKQKMYFSGSEFQSTQPEGCGYLLFEKMVAAGFSLRYVLVALISAFFVVFAGFGTAVFAQTGAEEPGPILNDALFAPDRIQALKEGRGGKPPLGFAPYGAGFYDTSEFMTGSASIAVILPESNGLIDTSTENWTATQEQEVSSEIQAAFAWWKNLNPKANLSFTYHFYYGRTDSRATTSYELINRNTYGVDYYPAEQHLWISEMMTKFGYSGDYFYQTRLFLDAMRNGDKTDWAFLVFVANSANDFDGTFPDGKFAFSYYGGPFMIMTYSNENYGISNMDAVAAHEMGHTFYALDQYYSAQKDCTLKLGYLNYENQNSEYSVSGGSCKSNVPSIMRGGISSYTQNVIDKYAKGQIGWGDTNKNGIPDAVDFTPSVSINSVSLSGQDKVYSGSASVSAKKNKNPYTDTLHSYYSYPKNNITTSVVQGVQYRIEEGSWQNATPSDGGFGSLSENFSFTVPGTFGSSPFVELKVTASSGNTKTTTVSGVMAKKKIVAGAGMGGDPKIVVFSNKGKVSKSFRAFNKLNKNGVKVAACNLDGSGKDEIIVSEGFTWPAIVKVFSSKGKKKSSFKVSSQSFGVNIACGDTNGDGKSEIIVSADYWDQPWVKILNQKGKVLKKFYAYDKKFKGGVYVAADDVNGDGKAEIVTGAGWGGGAQVRVFKASGKSLPISYWPYPRDYQGGVQVAAGDTNGDGKAEIITSQAASIQARLKVYRYNKAKTILGNFIPYQGKQEAPSIALGDVNGDGKAEVITALGAPRLQIKMFKGNGEKTGKDLYPFGKAQIGAYLATGRF